MKEITLINEKDIEVFKNDIELYEKNKDNWFRSRVNECFNRAAENNLKFDRCCQRTAEGNRRLKNLARQFGKAAREAGQIIGHHGKEYVRTRTLHRHIKHCHRGVNHFRAGMNLACEKSGRYLTDCFMLWDNPVKIIEIAINWLKKQVYTVPGYLTSEQWKKREKPSNEVNQKKDRLALGEGKDDSIYGNAKRMSGNVVLKDKGLSYTDKIEILKSLLKILLQRQKITQQKSKSIQQSNANILRRNL